MTLTALLVLFIAMVFLAILPGPGILVVIARSLSQGLRAGIVTSLGIITGDFVFIGIAVFGLSSLLQTLGDLFLVVKYIGAIYLIFLGLQIFFAKPVAKSSGINIKINHTENYVAGLLITLSNPKAILFYMSIFPALLDLQHLNGLDISLILFVTIVAVGGVMVSYAYIAVKVGMRVYDTSFSNRIKYYASCMLVGSGIYVAWRN